MQLDHTDFRILAALQEDGEHTIAQIAEVVHLSQNACWRRIRNMQRAGIIRGKAVLLNAAALGVGVTVFVTVRTNDHSDGWTARFLDTVRTMPEVVEFYRMSGDVDYLIKVLVADVEGYDRLYKRLIRTAGLFDVSSAFAMECIKQTTAIPLPRPTRS